MTAGTVVSSSYSSAKAARSRFKGRLDWRVLVAWLREEAAGQRLMLARYTPDLSRQLQKLEVAKLQARGHASGAPKLVVHGGVAWLVWTDVVEGTSRLQGARIAR